MTSQRPSQPVPPRRDEPGKQRRRPSDFTGDPGDRVPLAVIYALCTFVVVEVLSLAIGIVGSRLAAGRLRPGCYPLWGWTYFRWWLSDRLADLAPVHLLSGTPLLNGYLRAQGARIGRNVVIDSVTVRAPALLTVGDGVCIGTLVYVDNVRVHDGELIVGRVTLDRDASVDSYALLGEYWLFAPIRGSRVEGAAG